ncbi:ABC transporter permease subunit [Nonomuraea pusilla]|uniref:ABC-2 type transport system permease protein n=1 Tax=Nonomuraea pusilla TaxID=46177 RepID=A0A1H7FUF6_9ACTN|nr:ABC transporter permease subunit [Nonomuraea pusilla]SEK29589.1 ABC-2 type transport system permease protein [Nonomuraea pusilla]
MSFANVCAAELVKFRTLLSNRITVACALVGVALVGLLMGSNIGPSGNLVQGGPGSQAVASPMQFVMFSMMILGVLSATNEIRNGTFRVTLSIAPWRTLVLGGKMVTLAAISLAVTMIGLLIAYGSSLITASGTPYAPLSHGGTSVILAFLGSVPLVTALGVAVGVLVRSTAGALSILLVWAFAGEGLLSVVLPDDVDPYLPFMMIGAGPGLLPEGPGPVLGLVIFGVYVAIVVGLAFFLVERRDIS